MDRGHVVLAAAAAAAALGHCVDARYMGRVVATTISHRLSAAGHKPADTEAFFRGDATFERAEVVRLHQIDHLRHMSNSQYLQPADFARYDAVLRTGINRDALRTGKHAVVAALSIRYRRELALGQRYRIRTRCLGYDTVGFYLEHAFVAPFPMRDGSTGNDVAAVMVVRMQFQQKGTLRAALRAAGVDDGALPASRPPPADVVAWVATMKRSSDAVDTAVKLPRRAKL